MYTIFVFFYIVSYFDSPYHKLVGVFIYRLLSIVGVLRGRLLDSIVVAIVVGVVVIILSLYYRVLI